MIQLKEIRVSGSSESGKFAGAMTFSPGLQVISARNAYGKSLAVTAVAWCLGLDPLLGNQDNDPSCFPEAVRDELELPNRPSVRVISSECSVSIADEKGRQLRLTRAIKGDPSTVHVAEQSREREQKTIKLLARQKTMQDAHGGLQNFLFEWLGWPRERVATFVGNPSEVYLENLAPLFYIDQDEGWIDIQALQITRYRQLEISEISVEYLLGALDALRARVARQEVSQKSAAL